MLLNPLLGYYDEGVDLTDRAVYDTARGSFGRATTLPPASYRSRIFSALEDNRLWTRAWVAVGVAQQIPEAGDLLPFTIGYHGIHIQRGTDGALIGRFNKAQHGGCRSVPLQCQTGSRTRCSFTSCGYSRDRAEVTASELERDGSVSDQYLGLRPERLWPVRTACRGPLVFACLDPDASPLDHDLADCLRGLQQSPSSELRLVASDWLEATANWKLVGPALRDLLAPEAAVPRRGGAPRHAMETWPIAELSRTLPLADSAHGAGQRITFAWAFPNLLVLHTASFLAVIILQPLSMNETQIRLYLLVHDNDVAQLDGDALAALRQGWRGLLLDASDLANSTQQELSAWGTPSRPGTENRLPPVQRSPLGWRFQDYLIGRILDGSEERREG